MSCCSAVKLHCRARHLHDNAGKAAAAARCRRRRCILHTAARATSDVGGGAALAAAAPFAIQAKVSSPASRFYLELSFGF